MLPPLRSRGREALLCCAASERGIGRTKTTLVRARQQRPPASSCPSLTARPSQPPSKPVLRGCRPGVSPTVRDRHLSAPPAPWLARMYFSDSLQRPPLLRLQATPSKPMRPRRVRRGRSSLLHSSSRATKSTSALDFTHSSSSLPPPEASSGAVPLAKAVSPPDGAALRTLFVASAVPMVGFGFMDNLVLIQAGQYIDSTLGVSLGLATMTAAACGQVVSDVSGVVFGGTLERFLLKLSLIESPKLSTAQRQLPLCRNVSMAGAVLGVVLGCALGATTLLLVDLEKRARIERAQQLRDIVGDLVLATAAAGEGADGEEAGDDVGLRADSCCLYLASGDDFQLDPPEGALPQNPPGAPSQQQPGGGPWRTQLRVLSEEEGSSPDDVRECARRGKVVRSQDRAALCIPVRDADELLAVLEVRRRKRTTAGPADRALERGYSDADVRTARVIARHLGIFMTRLVE